MPEIMAVYQQTNEVGKNYSFMFGTQYREDYATQSENQTEVIYSLFTNTSIPFK